MKMPILAAGSLALALALALAGCETARPLDSSGASGSTGPAAGMASGSDSESLSWAQLGPGQRLALRQGCRALHGRDFTRYNQCVAGENRSQQALDKGCSQRYAGNPAMIRSCQGM